MARQMYGSCQVSSPLSFFRCSALRFVHLARVFLARPSHFWLVRVQTWPRTVHCVMPASAVPRTSVIFVLTLIFILHTPSAMCRLLISRLTLDSQPRDWTLLPSYCIRSEKNPNLLTFIRLVYIFLIILDYNFYRHCEWEYSRIFNSLLNDAQDLQFESC